MGELSEAEYRRLHRTLGGHADNFEEWYAKHRAWEAQRLAQPKRGNPDRVAQE